MKWIIDNWKLLLGVYGVLMVLFLIVGYFANKSREARNEKMSNRNFL